MFGCRTRFMMPNSFMTSFMLYSLTNTLWSTLTATDVPLRLARYTAPKAPEPRVPWGVVSIVMWSREMKIELVSWSSVCWSCSVARCRSLISAIRSASHHTSLHDHNQSISEEEDEREALVGRSSSRMGLEGLRVRIEDRARRYSHTPWSCWFSDAISAARACRSWLSSRSKEWSRWVSTARACRSCWTRSRSWLSSRSKDWSR